MQLWNRIIILYASKKWSLFDPFWEFKFSAYFVAYIWCHTIRKHVRINSYYTSRLVRYVTSDNPINYRHRAHFCLKDSLSLSHSLNLLLFRLLQCDIAVSSFWNSNLDVSSGKMLPVHLKHLLARMIWLNISIISANVCTTSLYGMLLLSIYNR